MKKIVAAWIEQILEFPTKLEYLAYIESLKKGKPQKFNKQLNPYRRKSKQLSDHILQVVKVPANKFF